MPITIDEPDLQKDWVCQRPGIGCPTPFDQNVGNIIAAGDMPNSATQTAVGIDPVAWKRFIIPALTLTFSAPPGGQVSVVYSHTLAPTGGKAPFTWSVTTGTLPTGLTLNAGTGVLSGTPTAAGSSTFTVKAADSSGQSATKSITLVIAS